MFHEMKPIMRRGLGLLVIVCTALVWTVSTGLARKQLRTRTCQGKGNLDVTVTDSLERRFVGKENIEAWLDKEYRAYAGLPLDSVDLGRIEHIIQSHSAVNECQAWLTDDGVLHVRLSQRQPVVRFDDGRNGYYADATGFLFPLQARGGADVPLVEGHIPLKVARGYKGEPATPEERMWLARMVDLACYMQGTVWEQNIRHISVSADGDLTLYPLEGKERFLFGPAVRVPQKFALMERYYESVAPAFQPGHYSTVDLRYRGQLVCRQ